jgi:hypothetical protein
MQMRAVGGLSGGLAGDGGGVIQRLPRHSALLVRTDLPPRWGLSGFRFYPRLAPWAEFFRRLAAGRFCCGLAARLKSCPSRSWRFPNPQRDGAVESHPSQSARDPLIPLRRALGYGSCRPYGTRFHFLRLTQDLRPGLLSAAPPGLRCSRRRLRFPVEVRISSGSWHD